MNIHEPLTALIERARKSVVQKKPWDRWPKADRLRADADALLGCAAEIQAAYAEQQCGEMNYRLSRDDVTRITRVALTLKHAADVWEWQQHPGVAQRLRANLSFEGVEGLPPRPEAPRTGLARPEELPTGFPERCLSWSEMATEFLQTRRGTRRVDERGVD